MKIKGRLFSLLFIVLFAAVGFWVFQNMPDHIEDTNGPEDFSLVTITDENIINLDMGARNSMTVKEKGVEVGGLKINKAVEIYSKKFTGVTEVMYQNYIFASGVVIELDYLKVESGNFKMVLVCDDEMIQVIEPSDEPIRIELGEIRGTLSLRIAGESAAYRFRISEQIYNEFEHH